MGYFPENGRRRWRPTLLYETAPLVGADSWRGLGELSKTRDAPQYEPQTGKGRGIQYVYVCVAKLRARRLTI